MALTDPTHPTLWLVVVIVLAALALLRERRIAAREIATFTAPRVPPATWPDYLGETDMAPVPVASIVDPPALEWDVVTGEVIEPPALRQIGGGR